MSVPPLRPLGEGTEQVLLDANREAEGKSYYDVGAHAVSAREDILAFQEDTAGRYQYALRFRDIATGKDHPERIPGLSGAVAWANDNRTVYYVEAEEYAFILDLLGVSE